MRTAYRAPRRVLAVTATAALVVSGLATPAEAATDLSCPAFANAANSGAFPVTGADSPGRVQEFTAAVGSGAAATVSSSPPAVTGVDGTFSGSLNLSGISDGALTITATSMGLTGATSDTCGTTKDTSPPAVSSLSASSSNSTSDMTVGGSTQPGSTVTIVVSDANSGTADKTVTATASGTGSFTVSVPMSGLSDGTITVRATATDPAGNTGPQATTTATRDSTLPVVTSLSSTPTNAANKVTTVTGTTEPSSNVTLSAANGAVTGNVVSGTDGTFSKTLDLSNVADGTITVTASAVDGAGNSGPQATTTSTKDTVGPTVSGLAATAVSTGSPVTTVTGTVSEAGADIVVTASDGTTIVSKSLPDLASTSLSTTLDLSTLRVGSISLSAIATDAAGNTGAIATATTSKTSGTTPSPTPTSTSTATPTPTPTSTSTATPTPTASATGTPTPSSSASPTSSSITGLSATDSGPTSAATVITGTTGAGRSVVVTLVNSGGDTATGQGTAGSTGAFSITVDLRSFRTSTVNVTAVSNDSSGSAGTPATTTLSRNGVPARPSQPGARAGDASVRVLLFGAPFDNGSALTGYRAVASPGGRVFTAPAGATSVLAQGLTNGVAYTFAVTASNSRGQSAAITTPAVTPRFATVLSLTGSPSPVVAGSPLRMTGSLKRKASGAPLVGFRVSVKAVYDNGTSKVLGTVATNTSGVWVLTTTPTQNANYVASYAGRPQDAPTSVTRRILARTKVTLSAPSGGARTAVVMSGSTSPNKRGAVVSVYRVVNGAESLVARATVSSTGAYRVSKVLARGTYVLVARIGATSGNTSGISPRVTTRRT